MEMIISMIMHKKILYFVMLKSSADKRDKLQILSRGTSMNVHREDSSA